MHLRQACVLQVSALTFVLAAALFRLQHTQQPLFKRHLAVRWLFPLRLEGGKEFRDLELLADCGDFLSAFGNASSFVFSRRLSEQLVVIGRTTNVFRTQLTSIATLAFRASGAVVDDGVDFLAKNLVRWS